MAIIDELVAVLGFKVEGEGDLKRFNNQLDKTESNASDLAAKLTAVGAAAGAALAAGMVKLGSAVINVSAQFEGYLTTLETVEGSASAAQKSFDWIGKFAATTPFEMEELTRAFVKLKSYGIDPMDGTMAALGDSASAMGKTLNDAVEMVADATTGSFERLKEFGIVASTKGDEVTFSWMKNGETLTKTVKKNGEEIRKFVLDNLGTRFGGAMVKQSKTWAGMMSNLADSGTMFLYKVGGGGFFEAVKSRLGSLLDIIGEMDSNGTLARIQQGLSDVFTGSINTIEQVAKAAWDVGKAFYYVADGIVSATARLTGLSKGMATAGLGAGLVASTALGRSAMMAVARKVPLVAALLVLEDLMSGFRGDDSLVGSTTEGQAALNGLQKSADDLSEAWAALFNAFGESEAKANDASEAFKTLFNLDPKLTWVENLKAQLARFVEDIEQILVDIRQGINAIHDAGAAIGIFEPRDSNGGARVESTKERRARRQSAHPIGDGHRYRPAAADGSVSARNVVQIDGSRFDKDPVDGSVSARPGQAGGISELQAAMANLAANMGKIDAASAGETITNDNRIANDNRSFPSQTSVTVNQTVTGPTAAPGAVARATGNAAAGAANAQKARIAGTPSTGFTAPTRSSAQ